MARYSSILSLRPILTVGKCLACCSLRRPSFFSLGGGEKRPSFLWASHDPEVKEVFFVRITLQLFGFTLSLVNCAKNTSCCNAGNILGHSGSYPVLVPLMADASIQGEEKGHSYIKRRVATTQYNARAFLLPPLLPSYQGWKRRQGHYPCLRCVHIPMYIAYGASCIVEMGPNAALDHANISTFWITTRNYLFLQYSLLSVCSLGISFRSLPSFLSSHLHQTDFAFFSLSSYFPLSPFPSFFSL